ncbi:MAG: ATP-dependent exoDNAse (exonuclease V) beta subunit [Nonlabens sp.]
MKAFQVQVQVHSLSLNMSQSPTTFYSASAGSGKTYTLAQDYLTLLFKNPYANGYRRILAVTFTNKAVGEMKERILDYLYKFTFDELEEGVLGIVNHIKNEAGLDNEQFKNKARAIFNQLLHDYSAFDIVTIDSFNHRILRTFAKDIDLPDNFEVELDSKRLISKAIHNLIARAGKDKKLTQQLVDFSLSKIEEGKSWDIEYDLQDIAKLIQNENHYPFLKQLKGKKVEDFLGFRESLYKKIKLAKTELKEKGKSLFQEFTENGLTSNDFFYKTSRVYKFITESAQGNYSIAPDTGYVKDMATATLENKAASASAKDFIESKRVDLVNLSEFYTENCGAIMFYKNIASSLTPLSLLNELLHEIDKIKVAEQIVPIYEFNALLAEQIKDEPAPFIYERLGERYRHYFIDEFQDTSRMQWENLAPLIENELQQQRENEERGSLMLVGDAKQSIYRFRGGDADQFLNLLATPDLFMLPKKDETLEFNWRSYDEVIKFNNEFFDYYGDQLYSEVYQTLYKKYLQQQTRAKEGGFIQIDFIDKDFEAPYDTDDFNNAYPYQVYQQIKKAHKNGFALGEICVLVRANKEGHEIAKYLVSQEMRVVSGDSLLVYASHKVQLLVSLMRMVQAPEQQKPRFEFLMGYTRVFEIEDIHSFVTTYLHQSLLELGKGLMAFENDDLGAAFAKTALFQATEQVAESLGLFKKQDTRLQSFLEFLFEYSTGYEVSLSDFLEHWELKKEKLSVPAAADADAVQIMTIHKSKGLEFPVVIVPHCDKKLDDARNPTGWVPVKEEEYEGFDQVYINLKKENEFYPGTAPEIYANNLGKVQMDQINTLYVAFTRAREQLYISAESASPKANNYSSLLKEFIEKKGIELETHNGYESAQIGDVNRKSIAIETEESQMLEEYKVCLDSERLSISTRKGLLWSSGASEAIQKGNVLHEYLSLMKDSSNLEKVRKKINRDFSLSKEEQKEMKKMIEAVISHPDLAPYYTKGIHVLNEQPILLPSGTRLIPDRVVFLNDEAVIIDYKTGAVLEKHRSQLNKYEDLLVSMRIKVSEKVLIYTDSLEIVKWNG